MATSKSTALKNAIAQENGVNEIMQDCVCYLYSNARAANADAEPGASPVGVITDLAQAFVAPTRANITLTLAAQAGTVDTFTIGGGALNLLGGAVTVDDGDLVASASALAAAINASKSPFNLVAVSDGVDTVTVYLPYWLGASGNGLTVDVTATGASVSINVGGPAEFSGGVDSSNGLIFLKPATAGVLSKDPNQTWKGYADTGGDPANITWFRLVAGGSSPTGSGETNVRLDGSVGVEVTANPSALVQDGAPITMTEFNVTVS